ncbi:MAG: nucleotidyl transferase AbiEii/AbiGii toxin family protein [Deltaproteobacteria bacterium]|nr:nucleotidyl transferase AbiEii/AbiGii toxin family protein [Deltaproteobacteria bacterium]
MIPRADIVAWRQYAPWLGDAQVEQDLLISRVLVAIFADASLAGKLAFRGGTALHKLYFNPARRYSEDIDLVQITAGPIGAILDALQAVLNGFLGMPKRKQTQEGATLAYRMESEGLPAVPMRLKVEINTREHVAFQGLQHIPFSVAGRWFSGSCSIVTFTLEELLATKLRALYQRRKGRDLFDIWLGLTEGGVDAAQIVGLFKHYMTTEGHSIDARMYEQNMQEKMKHAGFLSDLNPLLPAGTHYDVKEAFALLEREIIPRM